MLTRFTITAPLQDNGGAYRPAESFPTYADYARDQILSRLDGATAARGEGYWRDPSGALIVDSVTVWTIDVDDSRAGAVIHAAELIGTYADQEAVYVTATGAAGFRAVLVTPRQMPRGIVAELLGERTPA